MTNLKEHHFTIDRSKRSDLNNHRSFLVWFTGLSGSGKSTLANLIESKLHSEGFHTFLLDGDNIRLGLNKDLGFTKNDRSENLRRIGEVGKLMVDAGLITIAAFISPFEQDRKMVREILGKDNYIEIFVSTPLEECIRRDVKGLYKRALNGEIPHFTGVSSPYEVPSRSDLKIDTTNQSFENCLEKIYQLIQQHL
jgi:adenylylsulfate kinase